VAFGSGGRSEGSPDLPSGSQAGGFLPGAAPAPVQAFQPFAGIPKPFARGELRRVWVSNAIRIEPDEVEAFLNGHQRG
jgi:hypothetical protein